MTRKSDIVMPILFLSVAVFVVVGISLIAADRAKEQEERCRTLLALADTPSDTLIVQLVCDP